MKNIKKYLKAVVTVYLISIILVGNAYSYMKTGSVENTASSTSLTDVTVIAEGVELEINTDREKYKSGDEVNIKINITNKENCDIDNINIENILPKELEIQEEDKKNITLGKIKAGESISIELKAKVVAEDKTLTENNNNLGNNSNNKLPVTGSVISNWIMMIIAIIGIMVGIILVIKKNSKSKNLKNLSLILAITISLSLIAGSTINISALTINDVIKKNIEAKKTIDVNGEYFDILVKVSYDMETAEEKVSLNTEKYIYYEEDNIYYVDDIITTIDGVLVDCDNVKEFKYEILDDRGKVLIEGNIDIKDKWIAENIGYVVGKNILKLIITDKNGDIFSYEYIIINRFEENMEKLPLDKNDDDNDGLLNYLEEYYGCDKNNMDTDGDGLNDYYEVAILSTDPTKADSDDNGINDGDEDFDNDSITNLKEFELGSNPLCSDTDYDGLLDNEELNYKTNLNDNDTDKDNLLDSEEIKLGTDPLNPDSNGNGIMDGDEKFFIDYSIGDDVDNIIPSVNIELNGNQVDTLSIDPIYEFDDFLNSNIPGYIGYGYDFTVEGVFDSATINFEFNSNLLNTEGFVPAIYYYNEEERVLEELSNQSISGNTVSVKVSHFSKYILLNKTEFDKVWENVIKPPKEEGETQENIDIVLTLDSSGSMSWNDPDGIRKTVAKEFVSKLGDDDRAAVVDFDNYASLFSELTSDKEALYSAIDNVDDNGGTDIGEGVRIAINEFTNEGYVNNNATKCIILLTDGDGSYDDLLTQIAIDNNIVIYTVGLGEEVNQELLTKIAEMTGGNYYSATVAEDLINKFDEIREEVEIFKDSDGDGLSDYHEQNIRLGNGTCVSTDPLNPDTDNDGLLDGEEFKIYYNKDGSIKYYKDFSDPTNSNSDDDPFSDYEEVKAMGSNAYVFSMLSSDSARLLDDTCYVAGNFNDKYNNDAWFKTSVGIGNFIYGGERDYIAAYKKELMDYIELYTTKRMEDKIGENVLDEIKDNIKSVINFVKEVKGINDSLNEIKVNELLKELNDLYNQCDDLNPSEYMKAEVIADKILEKTDEINKLSKLDNKQIELLIHSGKKFKTKSIKVVKALVEGKKVFDTVKAYSKIFANIQIYEENLEILQSIKDNSNNKWMRDAATELYNNINSEFSSFCSGVNDLIQSKVTDVAVDKLIDIAGVYGVVIKIGVLIANLAFNVSGIAENSLKIIAIGEASRCFSIYLNNQLTDISTGGVKAYNIDEITRRYMGQISTLRMLGEKRYYQMRDSVGFLVKLTMNIDNVEGVCSSNIAYVGTIVDRYKFVAYKSRL